MTIIASGLVRTKPWPALAPNPARAVLLLVIIGAATIGLSITGADAMTEAVSNSGADLTRLLRLMAALKAVMAAGAALALLWRLGAAVTPSWFAAYALTCGAMSCGPGLIYGMAHVGLGALLLHGGLAATVILLWRDPVMAERLAAVLAGRRAQDSGEADGTG